jgi:transcriptional regulator with PAS, ATPase and Fis domain
VRGESGTGKEVIARAIHRLSGRTGAFVAVNCGALPDTLVESELFGFRKGAFSGANEDRPGLVRSAEGGTLFLDEIGDLPAASQAAFLRVLQEREVMPIGANRPVPVDFRLVAATHRDLEVLVEKEAFRGDLLARITGFQVKLPPLRERREDLGVLIAVLLRRLDPARAESVKFSVDAARAIFRHYWPANIRELEKSLGAAVVLAADSRIELDHLPAGVGAEHKQTTAPNTPHPTLEPPPLSVDDLRRKEQLHALLTEHAGNISAVARVMGKARMQIQRWIKRYGLDPESYKR